MFLIGSNQSRGGILDWQERVESSQYLLYKTLVELISDYMHIYSSITNNILFAMNPSTKLLQPNAFSFVSKPESPSWDLGEDRDAEPEPESELEPPGPTHFGRSRSRSRNRSRRSRSRSRSRSRRNGLLGVGAGAVNNGAAPAPKRDIIVAKKQRNFYSEITRNSWINSLPLFVINNFKTSAMHYLNFLDWQKHVFAMVWKSNMFFIR